MKVDNSTLEAQLAEINEKLGYLTAQVELQARRQRETQELKEDLNRIAGDFMQSAISELEDISPHFDMQDALHLLKKLMRNTRNLTALLDKLEGAGNLLDDLAPISKQAFLDVLHTLDEFDRKGYFAFLREIAVIVDRVVTSFTVEDVRLLAENIVTILETVKNLTQPDMLSAMNNAISVYKNLDFEVDRSVSYWRIAKQLKTPELRQGIAYGVEFLKSLSREHTNDHQQNYSPSLKAKGEKQWKSTQ